MLKEDVDQNGRVNFFDFQLIADLAAAGGAPLNVAAVPEPASGLLLALGGLLWLAARRRR